MSFTTTLRKETNHLFDACYNHPFVQGIGKGELSKGQLIHYVKQDFEYLNAMIQTRAYTMAKCTDREKMALLNEGISFILADETHPHHNFCHVAGVDYETLQGETLAPNAHHYSRYMLQVAQSGTLGEALAVALPCPWIYLDIGERLMNDVKPDESHPFYPWISFYGNLEMPSITKTLRWLDELAEDAGEAECERMRQHFINGCKMEYMFFDMAYTEQAWPV
ncbi:thiaminase II [Salipaludibacillus agaradhaerens]|uniref:thiaminase II n=1 Tax=Salipaludibacillus agaradhaerens TaxID=76935 RepID=UPI002151857C|nr:thiaminase II [Salipaludibacillus agaradhaerens]MCR6106095.1 thiaminase II [Salipaludibacillus agaradhaerens]MCR6118128.1 thiaminase II [Salipaludibacillus agaradhaerens]UJW57254.1 thiaminase II [Bacillus sp. A116_S68]